MKVLITGGAGFIGSHIADALLAQGAEVHILDNMFSGKRENIPAQARFFEYDILEPRSRELIVAEKYDAIYHQAAQMDVRKSVEDPTFDGQVNILGSINLLEGARAAGSVRKFIFASSGGAGYGEQDYFPADEAHPVRPLSPYGITKITVERYLYYYAQIHGLPYVALRYGNVYGPRQNPHGEAGVVAVFAQRLLAGQPTVINGDGLQTRDYVYVGDVVAANLAALRYEGSGEFNVGTGVETDVVTIFDELNRQLGTGAERRHGPAKAGEQRRSVLAVGKAQAELGWAPEYDFSKGLGQTVAWFRQRYGQGAVAH